MQRKPHKPVLDDGPAKTNGESKRVDNKEEDDGSEQNGELESPTTKEVKSDPESDMGPKKQARSRLSKFGSFSGGHTTTSKDVRIQKPAVGKTTTITEGAVDSSPPKLSKLQGPSKHKNSDASSAAGEDPPDGPAGKETRERPPSRLKFLGTGHTVQYHHGPLNKKTSGSANNLLTSSGEEASHSESKLRMQRKGSDGAIKRHQIIPSAKLAPVSLALTESGGSSLPRHLPKGTLSFKPSSLEVGDARKSSSGGGKSGASLDGGKGEGKSADVGKTQQAGHGGRSSSVASVLKRPGQGVRKSSSFIAGTVRTPNQPSGPSASSMGSNKHGSEDEGGVIGEGVASKQIPTAKSSQPQARQLIQPQARGESRLTRPSGISTKNKLHKAAVSSQDPSSSTSNSSSAPSAVSSQDTSNHSSSVPSASESRLPSLRGMSSGQAPSISLQRGKHVEVSTSNSSGSESGDIPTTRGKPADQKEVTKSEKLKFNDKEKTNKSVEKTLISPTLTNGDLSSTSDKAELKKRGEEEVRDEWLTESQEHLRIGRRISPEGMSHEEMHSGKMDDEVRSIKREESKERQDSASKTTPSSSSPVLQPSHTPPSHGHDQPQVVCVETDDSSSACSTEKEVVSGERDGEERQSRSSSQEGLLFSPNDDDGVQRARSLSPKSSHRLVPRGVARLLDMEGSLPGTASELNNLHSSQSSDSASSESTPPSSSTSLGTRKPLKSSMRQKGMSKTQHSSSSSSVSTEAAGGSPHQTRVTISPRSSQVRPEIYVQLGKGREEGECTEVWPHWTEIVCCLFHCAIGDVHALMCTLSP